MKAKEYHSLFAQVLTIIDFCSTFTSMFGVIYIESVNVNNGVRIGSLMINCLFLSYTLYTHISIDW